MNIDHGGILKLASNPVVRNKFPFIRFADKQLKANNKAPCCGKTKNYKSPLEIVETVKQAVLGLPDFKLDEFKRAVGVSEITVIVKDQSGRPQTITK